MITRNNQEQKVVRQTFAWTQLWPEDWPGWLRPLQLLYQFLILSSHSPNTQSPHTPASDTPCWTDIEFLLSTLQHNSEETAAIFLVCRVCDQCCSCLPWPCPAWSDMTPPCLPVPASCFCLPWDLETSTNCTLSALGQGKIIKLCRGKIFIGVA